MIFRYHLLFLLLLLSYAAEAYNAGLPASNAASNTLTRMPNAAFIENKGQLTDLDGKPASDVLYYVTLGSNQVFNTKSGLTFAFYTPQKHTPGQQLSSTDSVTGHLQRVDANFNHPHISKENIEVADVAGSNTYNYYKPGCRQGIFGLKTFQTIKVRDIYPGIDWIITLKNGAVKYSFNIAPHANAGLIEISYLGANALEPRLCIGKIV